MAAPLNDSGSKPFRFVKRQCSSVVSGIGSRYFRVQNAGSTAPSVESTVTSAARPATAIADLRSGEIGVRRGFEALGLPSTTKDILERAERWRPFRAYAVMHLWNAHPSRGATG